MQRPTKPLAAYNLFRKEIGPQLSNMTFVEQSKEIASKWKELTEEERENYKVEANLLAKQYEEALKKFYEMYPAEKIKDQQEKQQRVEKKKTKKEPKSVEFSEKNLKIFFICAFVKRYRKQYAPEYLPSSAKVKRELDAKYTLIDKDVWTEKWNKLSVEDRQKLIMFHKDWMKVKKNGEI